MPIDPTDETERQVAAAVRRARDLPGAAPVTVVGLDEVGRGALAGPLCLGACAITVTGDGIGEDLPGGIRDSKALTARARERLEAPIVLAARGWGLGWSAPEEIDEIGIGRALTRAALRALDAVAQATRIDAVLVDGSVDVLTPALRARRAHSPMVAAPEPLVHVQAKADRDCVSVAAASILAKVARDRVMVELAAADGAYGWARNKGYASAEHRAALAEHGPHPQHRWSWKLPGVQPGGARAPGVLWSFESRSGAPGAAASRKER